MLIPTSQPRRTSLGGTGLFLIVSGATIVTVALISAFTTLESWVLLPAIMLVLLLMAGTVVGAIGRLLGDEETSPSLPEPGTGSESA